MSIIPLKVQVDTITPSTSFSEAQKSLSQQGKRFDRETLQQIPYPQLHLCCIGSAGSAACSPRLVAMEKDRRLERYLTLSPPDLAKSQRWLQAEEMYRDVMTDIAAKSAPDWHPLRFRMKLVATLFCIYNHIDSPDARIVDALSYAREAAGEGVDPMFASEVCSGIVSISRKYLGVGVEDKDRIGDAEFREGIWKVMEAVLDVLSKEEQAILLKEHISGYICTSDCFRAY